MTGAIWGRKEKWGNGHHTFQVNVKSKWFCQGGIFFEKFSKVAKKKGNGSIKGQVGQCCEPVQKFLKSKGSYQGGHVFRNVEREQERERSGSQLGLLSFKGSDPRQSSECMIIISSD